MALLLRPPDDFLHSSLVPNEPNMVFSFITLLIVVLYAYQHTEMFVPVIESKKTPNLSKSLSLPLRENATTFYFQKRNIEKSLVNLVNALKTSDTLLNFKENVGNASVFWKKQIRFTNLFSSEDPTTRFLPLGVRLLLERKYRDGDYESFEVFGPVESLTVETDAETFSESSDGKLGLRVYGTARDSNWKNKGLPKVVHFLFTQEKSVDKTSVVILGAPKESGGTQDTSYRVSELQLRVASFPSDLVMDQSFFSPPTPGDVSAKKATEICTLLKNDTARLLYSLRAFAKMFHSQTRITSTSGNFDFVNDGGPLFVDVSGSRELVSRIVAKGVFYSHDTLRTTSESIFDITIKLSNGVTLSKICGDAGNDLDWFSTKSDAVGGVLTLLAFNKDPGNSNADIAEEVESKRYMAKVTLVWEKYSSAHWNSVDLGYESPETSTGLTSWEVFLNELTQLRRTNTFVFLAILMIVVLITSLVFWVVPSKQVAWSLARITAIVAYLFALILFANVLHLNFGVFADYGKELESAVFYAFVLLVSLIFLSVCVSLRFNNSIPTSIHVLLSILLFSFFFFARTAPTTNSTKKGTSLDRWRSMLLVVILQSGWSLSYEALKMGAKARAAPYVPILRKNLFFADISLPSSLLFTVFAFFVGGLFEFGSPSCDSLRERQKWLQQTLDTTTDEKHKKILDSELRVVKDRISDTTKGVCAEKTNERIAGFLVIGLILAHFVVSPLFRIFKTDIPNLVTIPQKNGVLLGILSDFFETKLFFVFSLISLVLILFYLIPDLKLRDDSEFCRINNELGSSLVNGFTDADVVFLSADKQRTFVENETRKLGCIDTETNAFIAVVFILYFVTFISQIIKHPTVRDPKPNVLEFVFFMLLMLGSFGVIIFASDEKYTVDTVNSVLGNLRSVFSGYVSKFVK